MTGTPDPNTLADELEADARYIDGECKCDLCDIQAGRLRAAARLLRTTNPQPDGDPQPPDHWCTCPPDVCRGIGPDEGGCSWCWAKDEDDPCPNAAADDEVSAEAVARVVAMSGIAAERDAAIADRGRLLDAIGDPDTLRGLSEHFASTGYPAHSWHLRRVADAAANTTGDTDD